MTLHKIKQTLVDEKKLLTEKQLTALVIKLGVTFITLGLDLAFMTFTVLGMAATVLVVFAVMFAFNWMFDMIDENEKSLKFVKIFSNLFILFIPLFFGEYLLFAYLRFV